MLNVILATALLAAAPAPQPASNLQCPVMGTKVQAGSATVVIRNQEYRICCKECAGKLRKDPNHYLNRDGSMTKAWEDTQATNHF